MWQGKEILSELVVVVRVMSSTLCVPIVLLWTYLILNIKHFDDINSSALAKMLNFSTKADALPLFSLFPICAEMGLLGITFNSFYHFTM